MQKLGTSFVFLALFVLVLVYGDTAEPQEYSLLNDLQEALEMVLELETREGFPPVLALKTATEKVIELKARGDPILDPLESALDEAEKLYQWCISSNGGERK